MPSATKIVNYTPEQTAQIVDLWVTGQATVAALAVQFGKSTRSIVAKLSREKVYTAKVAAKSATKTKAELISNMVANLELRPNDLASLEKASKPDLELLQARIADLYEMLQDARMG